jgi:uncharacterized protein
LKDNQKYIISFNGLKDGQHIFIFKLQRKFFDLFEVNEIKNVELNAEIQCIKKPNFVKLEFKISGYIETICDLCLEYYRQKIESTGNLIIRFGENAIELSDELIVIPVNQTEIDISQYLYDFSMLGLPLKRQHNPYNGQDGCNPAMINILAELQSKEEPRISDPRWNTLKKIKY